MGWVIARARGAPHACAKRESDLAARGYCDRRVDRRREWDIFTTARARRAEKMQGGAKEFSEAGRLTDPRASSVILGSVERAAWLPSRQNHDQVLSHFACCASNALCIRAGCIDSNSALGWKLPEPVTRGKRWDIERRVERGTCRAVGDSRLQQWRCERKRSRHERLESGWDWNRRDEYGAWRRDQRCRY